MKVIHDGDPGLGPARAASSSIGTFDGVHLGHQYVLRQLRTEAEARDVLSAVVTFDIHPALVLRPENAPKILMSLDQKIELLDANGVDVVYVVHFDHDRSLTTSDDFVRQVFADALHARAVVVGEDFHFGRNREGNIERLGRWAKSWASRSTGLELIRHEEAREPVEFDRHPPGAGGRRRGGGGRHARAALRGARRRGTGRRAWPHDWFPHRQHPRVQADGMARRRGVCRLVHAGQRHSVPVRHQHRTASDVL